MPIISTRNAAVVITSLGDNLPIVISATQWTVEVRADEIDITNFETGGFAQFLPSYVEAHISVDGFYNTSTNPFGPNSPEPLIMAGNKVKLQLYYLNPTTNNDLFTFPEAFIMSATGGSAVRDAGRVSFTARNYGAFSYPTGITFSGIDEI